jgi:hypothetical protein
MKVFNCKTDAKIIAAYARCADEQISNFETVFPWMNDVRMIQKRFTL